MNKGPGVTLPQVLEISRLETSMQQLLSQMSNTKPSVNYVRYDMKRKNKGGNNPPQQHTLEKFHGSGSLPSSGKSDTSRKSQTKGKICYRCGKVRHKLNQKCGAINAICTKCGEKGHYGVFSQKGKGFPHSSRSAHVVETSSDSTSQKEPDIHNECGQPIYVQSHMLQTMSTKLQKIPEKSKLLLEFPIRLHYRDLNQNVLLKVDWF